MGRFGNQIEQFLGMLAFAERINRTLVVPPWNMMQSKNTNFEAFENIFDINYLNGYHKVISMSEFMDKIAPAVWPHHKRFAFCFYERMGPLVNDCNAKFGSPFGDFWNKFRINFVDSVFYSPLTVEHSKAEWDTTFPIDTFPVLAFVGPPSAFPVKHQNKHLQRYLRWSATVDEKVDQFLRENVVRPVVAVHLRNGPDFNKACALIDQNMVELFSSSQCHGDFHEHSPYNVSFEMCSPSQDMVLQTIKYSVRLIAANSVYIATDYNPMIKQIREYLMNTSVKQIVWHPMRQPYFDLALLGRADLSILNCVSSFSAAAKRERDLNRLATMFFGLKLEDQRSLELLTSSYGVRNSNQSCEVSHLYKI